MPKKFATPEPLFGSFTPADPNAPPPLLIPEEPPLPVPETVPAVPVVFPAGQTYEAFLYEQLSDLEATVDAMSGGSDFTTDVTTPSDGDLLIYDNASGDWINVTQDSITGFLPITGGTITGSPGNLIVNAPNGDTGAIFTCQVNGASGRRFVVSADSDHILELIDTANTGPTATLQISHRTSSGTPSTGFGSSLQFWGEDTAHTRVHFGTVRTEASDNTPAAVSADLVFLNQQAGTSTECLRVKGSDGRAQFATGVQSPYVHVGDIITHPATLHISRSGAAANPSVFKLLRVKAVADTALTSEPMSIDLDLGVTHQIAAGFALTRSINITGGTISATAAQTITDAATLYINGGPAAGTNVTITRSRALYCIGAARFELGAGGTHIWDVPQDDTPVGAAVGRIPIYVNGTTRYVSYNAA